MQPGTVTQETGVGQRADEQVDAYVGGDRVDEQPRPRAGQQDAPRTLCRDRGPDHLADRQRRLERRKVGPHQHVADEDACSGDGVALDVLVAHMGGQLVVLSWWVPGTKAEPFRMT